MEMHNTGESDPVFPLQIVKSHWNSKTWSVFKQVEASLKWWACSASTSLLWFKCFHKVTLVYYKKISPGNSWKDVELWLPLLSPALEHCWKLCALQWNRLLVLSLWVSPDSPQHPALSPFTFRLAWQDYDAFSFLLPSSWVSELMQAAVCTWTLLSAAGLVGTDLCKSQAEGDTGSARQAPGLLFALCLLLHRAMLCHFWCSPTRNF